MYLRLLGHYYMQNHMKAEDGVDRKTLINFLHGASPSPYVNCCREFLFSSDIWDYAIPALPKLAVMAKLMSQLCAAMTSLTPSEVCLHMCHRFDWIKIAYLCCVAWWGKWGRANLEQNATARIIHTVYFFSPTVSWRMGWLGVGQMKHSGRSQSPPEEGNRSFWK